MPAALAALSDYITSLVSVLALTCSCRAVRFPLQVLEKEKKRKKQQDDDTERDEEEEVEAAERKKKRWVEGCV